MWIKYCGIQQIYILNRTKEILWLTWGEDVLPSVEDNSGGQVDGHEGRLGQEVVVETDHVPVVGQHVAEPRDQPGQGEYGAQLGLLQVQVQLRVLTPATEIRFE